MAILAGKSTRILVQGLTGKTGSLHTELSLKIGTNIVGGVSPGKGGQRHLNLPVFDTVARAKGALGSVDASLIYVPAPGALEAILEAMDADIGLIMVITEGIPVSDMVKAKKILQEKPLTTLIGPNCPGILVPGECRLGIIPGNIATCGTIGIVSRSGTLTYEAAYQIARAGLGVSTVVGIGGDPVIGTDFIHILKLFDQDPKTQAILMIGEIGGAMEAEAAECWSVELGKKKPLFSFIAGKTAPPGKRMGHAGALIEGKNDSALAKIESLRNFGVSVVDTVTGIGQALSQAVVQA